jgi:hypothetical protein
MQARMAVEAMIGIDDAIVRRLADHRSADEVGRYRNVEKVLCRVVTTKRMDPTAVAAQYEITR